LSSFWFILKQQWTIEEISIFSNSSHLEWRAGLSDTIFKGIHPRTIPVSLKQQWTIKIASPLFSIFSLAAILVGSRDHRTHFWKGAIQGPFQQSLVQIGSVVSEEKIKM
jgi:hypothetical protein